MNIGITDGTRFSGLTIDSVAGDSGTAYNAGGAYGVMSPAISGGSGTKITANKGIGITTDPDYSGIVCDLSAIPTFKPYFYISY